MQKLYLARWKLPKDCVVVGQEVAVLQLLFDFYLSGSSELFPHAPHSTTANECANYGERFRDGLGGGYSRIYKTVWSSRQRNTFKLTAVDHI